MANLINRRQFTIEWGHCDPAGIVFDARFFEFFDWGTWTLFELALGVKPPDLGKAFGIVGIPLGRCRRALSGASNSATQSRSPRR